MMMISTFLSIVDRVLMSMLLDRLADVHFYDDQDEVNVEHLRRIACRRRRCRQLSHISFIGTEEKRGGDDSPPVFFWGRNPSESGIIWSGNGHVCIMYIF